MKNIINTNTENNNILVIEYDTQEYAISQGWIKVENRVAIDQAHTIKNIKVFYDNINNRIINVELPEVPKEIKKSWKGFTKKTFLQLFKYFIENHGLQILDQKNNSIFVQCPRNLYKATHKKQKGTISDVNEKNESSFVDFLKNNNNLNDDKKIECLENLGKKNYDYDISQLLGEKVPKNERRVLRTVFSVMFKKIKQNKSIKGLDSYGAIIEMSEIYAEYGLPKNKQNKYDYNQTKPIKDIILNRNKKTDNALHKQILFKEGELYVTRFLLQVNPDEKTTKGKTQLKSIKLSMPEFLFIPNKNARNYYPLDTTGFKRFMEIKGMSKSVAAFNLAEFLEYYLSNPDQEREVNFDTLLKEAGNDFQERYKKSPTEIQQKIENILNNLVKAEYLIKSWRIEKGKWGQSKYIFKNSRYELFQKIN